MNAPEYIYLGDRLTDAIFQGVPVYAVRTHTPDGRPGKCVRGRNGTMLVKVFPDGPTVTVIGRRLRKIKTL